MSAIKEQLIKLADEKYRMFTSSITPGAENILGVRLPVLRKIAKDIAKGDYISYFNEASSETYEEKMLQGMVIGYIKADIDEVLKLAGNFIPLIDNWAICDSFCAGLKITKLYKEKVWDFLQPYLHSLKEFEIRFGIVMIINYFIDEIYAPKAFEHFDRIKHEGYYVKMAIAWAISAYFVKQPDITLAYIKNNRLDDFTHNKGIQKIIESRCVDKSTKDMLKVLKRPRS
ncbi:3-methyladenine DNA glycosylase AlkD [Herbinix hemicellulosilytica]|uniref:3-methyladenine DNA glycosylase AlkD n=1 Tax=Herbinix hemicellulosilytica TaxID=1564487 RepID=A0A0H5SJL9_HERHM|nr:DNA alkylation repair protein [Herbinix hemicellulosilytica]RBP56854.1 3-methyladenine DNA glycosylase AlkD [Herbinix hemicellulosilytica]CRZ35290.1 hypothetical protein HHT355_2092 [Herbinix hemicellulosilytica]